MPHSPGVTSATATAMPWRTTAASSRLSHRSSPRRPLSLRRRRKEFRCDDPRDSHDHGHDRRSARGRRTQRCPGNGSPPTRRSAPEGRPSGAPRHPMCRAILPPASATDRRCGALVWRDRSHGGPVTRTPNRVAVKRAPALSCSLGSDALRSIPLVGGRLGGSTGRGACQLSHARHR